MDPQNKFVKSLHQVSDKIFKTHKNISNFSLVKRKNNIVLLTRLQSVFNLKFSDSNEQSVFDIIINHAVAAEKMGPGAFDLFIENAHRLIGQVDLGNYSNDVKDILGAHAQHRAAVPVKADVDWVLSTTPNMTDQLRSILLQALMLAGFGGRIVVEKTQSNSSVELVKGFTFELEPLWPVVVELKHPRLVCIDGFIESVSEIHHLLHETSEAKEPVVLFSRGMADDVKQTLRVNYDRGSLRIIPIVVKFELEGINTLNDICVVSGTKIVSSTKGDVISSIRLEEFNHVDKVVIYPTQVVVTNSGTGPAIAHHLNFLMKKREDEKTVDISKLIDQRIRSLTSNYVVIRLPDDKNFVVSSQCIDHVLRSVKSLVDHGTVMIKDRRVLTSAFLASEFHIKKCSDTLENLGASVLVI